MKKFPRTALISALACASFAANAGRSCDAPKPPAPQMIMQGMNLAEKTFKALEAEHAKSGVKVVVLARAGQDLSKYGLHYSHLGFAYKAPDGRWLIAHKLNTCGTAEASLYKQGLGEFFLDDLFRFEAAWVVPSQGVQDKLHAALLNESRIKAMHAKPYSMVSYAWATKYQQSNQWAIETLAAAMDGDIRTRSQAQAWLQLKNYAPTTLNISLLTRLGGRITQANIEFDDHPSVKRFSDRIETVTVDSVFEWLSRTGLAAAPVRLGL